jgi:hypothetical protein
VIGAGAVLGIGYLFLRTHTATASPREGGTRPAAPRAGAFPPLVERWRSEVAKRAGDLPVDALLEWIRIESGGDMAAGGLATEAGIWQLMFPDDGRYGATLARLKALAADSAHHDPHDLSWLSDADLDQEVGSGIRKVQDARDIVRKVLAQTHVPWSEHSFDFGSAVKQIHATPSVITELLPKITRQSGPPGSWSELRQRVNDFPTAQMSPNVRRLALAPSQHGLKNRLEDTMRNAELVGRYWT